MGDSTAPEPESELPDGALDYREYFFDMDGEEAGIAFTLDDLEGDNDPARYARSFGASAFGMVFLFHVADSPRLPLLWLQRPGLVGLQPAGFDRVSDDLKRLIGPYLSQFFADIAPDHPQLAQQLMASGLLAVGPLN